MKFLTTKLYGFINYIFAILLFFMPTFLDLQAHTAESIIFYVFGIFTIFLSLQTDYELGVYKVLPMEIHIYIEIVCGLFFALSPWIFNFASKTFLPYLFFGGLLISLAVATGTFSKSLFRFLSIGN